jgi:DNA-binding CsgD family transcriptional regulator
VLITKLNHIKPKSTWVLPVAKAGGTLVLFGSILSLVELNKPWSINLSIQVLATTVIVGGIAFAVGAYSKQQLNNNSQRDYYWRQLSMREQEVAHLLLTTFSNKEICQQLFIEPNTLKTHIRHIYKKTHATSRESFIQYFQPEND